MGRRSPDSLPASTGETVAGLIPRPRETEDNGNQPIKEDTMDGLVKPEVTDETLPHANGMHANDMCALGELICRLNPYTRLRKDPVTGQSTSGMAIEPTGSAQPHGAAPPSVEEIIAKIPVEVVPNYGAKWIFKGQSLAVKTAVRIPYRFEVTTQSGEKYWQTETLLIGYAGGDGPG
jgi:hypothetical protein